MFWIQLLTRLAVCHRQMRRQLAMVAAAEGLNDTEFLLLSSCQISSAFELSQQELAANTGLSASQASGLFESLRSKGLLTMLPSQRDRRRQRWQITAEGNERLSSIARRLRPLTENWESCLSPADRQLMLDTLQRWSRTDPGAQEAA